MYYNYIPKYKNKTICTVVATHPLRYRHLSNVVKLPSMSQTPIPHRAARSLGRWLGSSRRLCRGRKETGIVLFIEQENLHDAPTKPETSLLF
jgi:hypothetical protein